MSDGHIFLQKSQKHTRLDIPFYRPKGHPLETRTLTSPTERICFFYSIQPHQSRLRSTVFTLWIKLQSRGSHMENYAHKSSQRFFLFNRIRYTIPQSPAVTAPFAQMNLAILEIFALNAATGQIAF